MAEVKCGHNDRPYHADGMCRSCYYEEHKQDWKDRYSKNRDAIRARHRQNLYGITPEEYDYALRIGCAACGRPFGKTPLLRPNVDHDQNCCPTVGFERSRRTCGKCRRGVICGRCNVVLGMLEEEPRLLPQYLLDYLRKFGKKLFP